MHEWRKYNGSLIPIVPPHKNVDSSKVDQLINETNSYLAMWTTDFDYGSPTKFWHIICDKFIPFDNLSSNTRSKIRRSEKKFTIRMVNKNFIMQNGFECYDAAFKNYKSYYNRKSKRNFVDHLLNLEGEWHFWVILFQKKIIAFSQNRVIDKYCEYSTIKFHPQYLRYYSSYLLFHTMNRYYLQDCKFKYVNNGMRNLTHKTNIQSFLTQKFGFRKSYCKLSIRYNRKIRFFLSFIYPFRFVFYPFNTRFALRIKALFALENVRRSCLRNE